MADIQEPQRTNQSLQKVFDQLDLQAAEAIKSLVREEDLGGRLEALVHDRVPTIIPNIGLAGARWTIHIIDIAFTNSFLQAIDYYPMGKGAGRTFSTRFGIVGKAWRIDRPEIQGDVSHEPDVLILDWGMTKAEADAAVQDRPSFLCVPIRSDGGRTLGMLYADSLAKFAFIPHQADAEQETKRIAAELQKACDQLQLTAALANVLEKALKMAPLVNRDEIARRSV